MPDFFADEILTQPVRDAIRAFALNGRQVLTREARDLLEGVYGLHADGTLEKPENLPALKDPETRQKYDRLKRFLKDETQAGLAADEAVNKLVKEIAFTHLNRLVAFKMLESNKLIRTAVGKATESNGFKFYLADHPEDEARWRVGQVERAYTNFLRWLAGETSREVPVLFDADDLSSHLFPRLPVLNEILASLNSEELAAAWSAEETIGWIYQFFNALENQAVFDRLFKQKKKIRREDIPAATQRFTPRWIVRYLVENTLGRLWIQMHPDSALGSKLRYLVPSPSEIPAEKLRPVKEISLLDPACGTMHFGLVAFDLFAEMYREEMQHAGTPGWPEQPSVANEAEIPAAILEHNLFGIDIDLRATQLAALTLYIKAKRANPSTQLRVHNLACADVLPFSTADLARFLVEMRFTNPIFEKMLRRIREHLTDIQQVGSLLPIERELRSLVEEQRRKDTQKRQSKYGDQSDQPALLGVDEQAAMDAEYYSLLEAQLVQALDFFRKQADGQGEDLRFFTGEATKSLRVLDLFLRRYDVVLANPPYLSRQNMTPEMISFLDQNYSEANDDLFAAFIARCAELAEEAGRVGMITQQSFMFISSYEELRAGLLETFAIETMAHTGPYAFPEIKGKKVNTTAYILRREVDSSRRAENVGTYFRLVHAPDADAKRIAFESALEALTLTSLPANVYTLPQAEFQAIPGNPWVYWLSNDLRMLYRKLSNLEHVAQPRQGLATASNPRFIRFWWEVGINNIGFKFASREQAKQSKFRWFPISKGSKTLDWAGTEYEVINWKNDGRELFAFEGSVVRNPDYYFRPGITLTRVGPSGFSARYNPMGQILDSSNSGSYPKNPEDIIILLGILNSKCTSVLLSAKNPTINFQVGDLNSLPIPSFEREQSSILRNLVAKIMFTIRARVLHDETSAEFVVPLAWSTGLKDIGQSTIRENQLEFLINDEVFLSYGISDEDRAAIEAELAGGVLAENDIEESEQEEGEDLLQSINAETLAAYWVSYALGIVLGRFVPRALGGREQISTNHRRTLGSAAYYREDFAIGSLTAPSEEEFNELVGTPDQFGYIDQYGGRHVFLAQVEQALQALAIEDGIGVLEAGHPHDLVVRVEKALTLMLGEADVREVVDALGGEALSIEAFLRRFLEKDYFTQWHFRWYRKRPIYWPIQSTKRSYGFVLFHEKITRDTFYAIQRKPYLETRRNAVDLKISDLQDALAGATGGGRKKPEKDLDDLRKLSAELDEFAKALESITLGGYNPAPEWIDDGVILRMAPLWKVIPIWKTEPKKYWDRLEAGDFDWSHIAMNYRPDQVKAKCKTNKSYAIAHGHEEWYEGK